MENTSQYDKQATAFLKKTVTSYSATFLRHGKHFTDEKETRDVYICTFTRGLDGFHIIFGQSLKDSTETVFFDNGRHDDKNKPRAYDVLACLQKNDPGTFEDFCSEFGYEEDSKAAEKIYIAVCDEWKNVSMLWDEKELSDLQDIQ